jgi:AcrR family transcriptional regulator
MSSDLNGRPARQRARRGEGERLRGEILEAAGALLADGGVGAVTMRSVADAVGVSTPAVYLHFASKIALLDALCLRSWETLERAMLAASGSTDDPFQALRRRGAAYVRFGLDHAAEYRLLMTRDPDDDRPDAARAADLCLAHIQDAVEPCVQRGVLLGDAQQLAIGIWAAMHGCVELLISQPQLPWREDDVALGEHVARMSGLGTAALNRVVRLDRVPDAETYIGAFDAFAARLGGGDRPSTAG